MTMDTDLATKTLLEEIKAQRMRIDDLVEANNRYLEQCRASMRERDAMARALLASAQVGAALARIVMPYLSDPIVDDEEAEKKGDAPCRSEK